MLPAGVEKPPSASSRPCYIKDPTDPQFQKGKEWDDFVAFMKKYHPTGAMNDNFNVYGYTVAQLMTHVLQKAGDNLTRENIMKQAASLDLTLPMLLPGVNVKTAPDDFFPIEREQLAKFDGKTLGAVRQGLRPLTLCDRTLRRHLRGAVFSGAAMPVTVIHEDEALLVVDKPAGLLAVPGRGADKQDCLVARVQARWPDALVVHRLDMATSGPDAVRPRRRTCSAG